MYIHDNYCIYILLDYHKLFSITIVFILKRNKLFIHSFIHPAGWITKCKKQVSLYWPVLLSDCFKWPDNEADCRIRYPAVLGQITEPIEPSDLLSGQ